MAIKKISEKKFDSYNIDRALTLPGIVSEKQWFADDQANLLGIVLFDNVDSDWSYVVLDQENDGKYRFVYGEVSLRTEETSRSKLIHTMSKISVEGLAVETLYEPKQVESNFKTSLSPASLLHRDSPAIKALKPGICSQP
jgi:hypothetical protein